VDLNYAQVIRFRDGRAVEVDIYLDATAALEAAGLLE
jgi:ketosteroid isomerase-like protein